MHARPKPAIRDRLSSVCVGGAVEGEEACFGGDCSELWSSGMSGQFCGCFNTDCVTNSS